METPAERDNILEWLPIHAAAFNIANLVTPAAWRRDAQGTLGAGRVRDLNALLRLWMVLPRIQKEKLADLDTANGTRSAS